MKMKRLGKTDLEVSMVGLGGIPIQNASKEEAYELIKEAYEEGINFIDTARGYEESEALIGYGVEKLGRDKFILATKSMDRTYDGVLKEIEISLKNLRTDYIDLFQFHNVKTDEEYQTIMGENGALKAVKELQDKGVIKEIGITSHNDKILDKALDTDEFVSIQFPYNPVETHGEYIFEKARKKDVGVIIMKPLAGGNIAKGELCLRFIFENENITTAIPGMGSKDEIRENVRAGKEIRPLTESEKEEIAEEINTLGKYFCRRCGYCAPCSEGMDIPTQFLFEGYYTRYDLKDWAKERYNNLEVNASDCSQCGNCEPRCPYDLPIMDMLVKVDKVLA